MLYVAGETSYFIFSPTGRMFDRWISADWLLSRSARSRLAPVLPAPEITSPSHFRYILKYSADAAVGTPSSETATARRPRPPKGEPRVLIGYCLGLESTSREASVLPPCTPSRPPVPSPPRTVCAL